MKNYLMIITRYKKYPLNGQGTIDKFDTKYVTRRRSWYWGILKSKKVRH